MIFVEYVVFAVFFVTIGAIAGFFAKSLIYRLKDRKSRPSKKAIEEWIKNGNVIIVEEENIEHNTSL